MLEQKLLAMLSTMPAETLLGFLVMMVGIVTGVFISLFITVFAIWLTNRSKAKRLNIRLQHEKSIKKNSIKKEKLEELHVLTDRWIETAFDHYMKLSSVMRGEIDYNQYQGLVIEEGKERATDFFRLGMIVNLYSPELYPPYKEIITARSELNKIAASHKRAYRAGTIDGRKYLKPYTDAIIKLERLNETFKKGIVEHAREA